MGQGVRSLTEICQTVILRNHLLLDDLGEIRYELLQRVFDRFTAQQLINIERLNPKLILEDENIWAKKLQQDFPRNVMDRYTTDFGKIRRYFIKELESLNYDYQSENLEGYLEPFKMQKRSVVLTPTKFKLPSRLLYFKYKEDKLQKEQEALLRLRERMKSQRESRKEAEIIHIKEVIPTHKHEKTFRYPGQYYQQQQHRSKLFQKSKHEAVKQGSASHFRSNQSRPRVVMPASEPGFHSRTSKRPTTPIQSDSSILPEPPRSYPPALPPQERQESINTTRKLPRNRHLKAVTPTRASATEPTTMTSNSTYTARPNSTPSSPQAITAGTTNRPISPIPRPTSSSSSSAGTKAVNIFNNSAKLKRQRLLAASKRSKDSEDNSTETAEQITHDEAEPQTTSRPYKRIKLSDYLSMKRSSKA
ncbi:hypothetical protein WICPIJ_007164 [Wickerhamomyces pijperi]|uniref:Elongin-A n=1 Tax=Wickerhamomyces pijperi TaxID=599730 RepID=A0A9P8TJI0_WICPI|nr:hypothetical protein WICPIJ_007164 [Wickerhamomyces pijperi]